MLKALTLPIALLATIATADDSDLQTCAKFVGDIAKLQCYEAVLGHAGKPDSTLTVLSAPPPPVPVPPSPAEQCQSSYGFAMTVMRERQSGRPMPEMISLASGDSAFIAIAKDAYSRPAYATRLAQQREIEQFGNDYYAGCLDAVGS